LTPELVSIIFHFCGDGHLAKFGGQSSYRQVNKQGLHNFIAKIKNCFGEFPISDVAIRDYKATIPRLIADFYSYYFDLGSCCWKVARIPCKIKNFDKEFLVAGLTSFIVDEGHIGNSIEIYSSNRKLLGDIAEIAKSLGYLCKDPKIKSKKHKQDFRMYISTKSAKQFAKDISHLSLKFPTCDLVHKQHLLDAIVERQIAGKQKTSNGVMKNNILSFLLTRNSTVKELSHIFKIAPSSVREHLRELESKGLVNRTIRKGKHLHLWEKVDDSFLVEKSI
jgi:DNA-binding transcriptional ArsR family regulator